MPRPTKGLLADWKAFFRAYRYTLLWAAFILLLCGLPGKDLPKVNVWDFQDKIIHFWIFGILGVLSTLSFDRLWGIERYRSWAFATTVFAGIAYSGLTELLQDLVFIDRYADLSDFLSNAAGMVAGCFAMRFALIRRR